MPRNGERESCEEKGRDFLTSANLSRPLFYHSCTSTINFSFAYILLQSTDSSPSACGSLRVAWGICRLHMREAFSAQAPVHEQLVGGLKCGPLRATWTHRHCSSSMHDIRAGDDDWLSLDCDRCTAPIAALCHGPCWKLGHWLDRLAVKLYHS